MFFEANLESNVLSEAHIDPLIWMAIITILFFTPTVPCIEGGACIIMPVDGYWLCLPASHVRPFVQPVRVIQPCPHCCWFPGARPSVPAPSCVPALLPRGSHSVALPAPPSSSAPPFTSQASCSTDRRLCPSSPTADGRQEKKVILNIPPKLFKATMKYN